METNAPPAKARPGAARFLLGGLIAGIIAAVLNNVYSIAYTAATGLSAAQFINPGSVTILSALPLLIGSLVYFGLSRWTDRATLLFVIGTAVLVLLSLGGPFSPTMPDGSPRPEGFVALTLPMHLAVGIASILIVPRLARR